MASRLAAVSEFTLFRLSFFRFGQLSVILCVCVLQKDHKNTGNPPTKENAGVSINDSTKVPKTHQGASSPSTGEPTHR
jgi:hypothetical protein